MTNFGSDTFCILSFKPTEIWLAFTSKAGLLVTHLIICMTDPLAFLGLFLLSIQFGLKIQFLTVACRTLAPASSFC